ncbi:MAG: nitroreductase family deazaflavin-dependent oxidoreductase [Chloroflexi bacterium]|nr:nitroreductase family deazaflavin-dependent oxidoreductase [Chloroflexota bacterium]
MAFERHIIALCEREREVELTTSGRVTGRPTRVTIWITAADGHLYIRSGRGMTTRDWPRNLRARAEAILHVAGQDVPVRARILSPVAARAVSDLVTAKYGVTRAEAPPGEPTLAETATFELSPAPSLR